jgi:AcrR family transcriptional regulator
MAIAHEPVIRRRPGGRSARIRASVLKAFLQELTECGNGTVAVEEVAARARVHKSTLYRRWGTVDELLREAARELSKNGAAVPDTGVLRDDLVALAHQFAATLASQPAAALLRAVIARADVDAALGEIARTYWLAHLDRASVIVRLGVERGELPISTDPHLFIEALMGPLLLRALLTREHIDDAYIDALVDATLTRGIT